eukprot:COSAG02_NODE_328_length_24547_cov_4.124141_31_plen_226_part_00
MAGSVADERGLLLKRLPVLEQMVVRVASKRHQVALEAGARRRVRYARVAPCAVRRRASAARGRFVAHVPRHNGTREALHHGHGPTNVFVARCWGSVLALISPRSRRCGCCEVPPRAAREEMVRSLEDEWPIHIPGARGTERMQRHPSRARIWGCWGWRRAGLRDVASHRAVGALPVGAPVDGTAVDAVLCGAVPATVADGAAGGAARADPVTFPLERAAARWCHR